jgi:hypothetical protein
MTIRTCGNIHPSNDTYQKVLSVGSIYRRKSMPVDSNKFEDGDGNIVQLLWYDDVRITGEDDYLEYIDGVVCTDQWGTTQVIPKEYFNRHFRMIKQLREA